MIDKGEKGGHSDRKNKNLYFYAPPFFFFFFFISGAISGESGFRSTFNNGFGKDIILCLLSYSDFYSCVFLLQA